MAPEIAVGLFVGTATVVWWLVSGFWLRYRAHREWKQEHPWVALLLRRKR